MDSALVSLEADRQTIIIRKPPRRVQLLSESAGGPAIPHGSTVDLTHNGASLNVQVEFRR